MISCKNVLIFFLQVALAENFVPKRDAVPQGSKP